MATVHDWWMPTKQYTDSGSPVVSWRMTSAGQLWGSCKSHAYDHKHQVHRLTGANGQLIYGHIPDRQLMRTSSMWQLDCLWALTSSLWLELIDLDGTWLSNVASVINTNDKQDQRLRIRNRLILILQQSNRESLLSCSLAKSQRVSFCEDYSSP